MALQVTHQFVSAVADGADTEKVQPSDWNAAHSLSMAPAMPPPGAADDSDNIFRLAATL